MALVTLVVICLGVIGPLACLAAREHRIARERRTKLLDACSHVLHGARLTQGTDAFPRLQGTYRALDVDVQLICDAMTPRRLPQLWLQVTVLERRPDIAGLAVLVRPTGYEFFSLTETLERVIEPPQEFPAEVVVRGKTAHDERTLNAISSAIAAVLTDPRVKEVAVTGQGLRIIRQVAEGRRGEYLLLRQAVFDTAAVPAECLERTLLEIEDLRAALEPAHRRSLDA